ncbi:prune homolog 2-like [Pelobates cultripes]|nr:prune homolog 2-like [Pelobates cultripes]
MFAFLSETVCVWGSCLKCVVCMGGERGKQLEKVHTVIGNKCCDLDSIISTLTYAYYLDKERGKQLEKVHTVIGNKCCDLDSIISTLTYAYYLDKITSPNILCLPVLNISRVEFNFYSETRFILGELDIPESFLIFRDEINLQSLNDEGRLSITLVNFSTMASDDESLEASVVKVINPGTRLDGVQMVHDSSSSLVAQEILEEGPELVTRQLAHLLRGSILFSWLSAEHERIPAQQEDIVYMLEEKFPELPPRQDIISCLQETKLHTHGTSIDEILLKDIKELSDGDIKVAICTIYMTLEEIRKINYGMKTCIVAVLINAGLL